MFVRKKLMCVIFSIIVLFTIPGMSFADESDSPKEDKTLAPYFLVDGGSSLVERFPLKDTRVKANINGVIADVYVTQTYVNNGEEPINATYVFPASTRTSVHGMKMTIGGHVITAKIKERKTAKREFEQAKAEGKSASLLEQQRPNVFTMSVANIMPEDEVNIELHYTEMIIPTDGVYQFVFPAVVGPRYSNQTEANAHETDKWIKSPYLEEGNTPPAKFGIDVTLTTGIPLQELRCTSHEVDVSWENKSAARVSYTDSEEFGGNRDFILDYMLSGKEVQCGLMLYEGEDENYFLLMVQPPERVQLEDITPREYIFVLDVSGSMHGYPLDTAKVLIKDLIGNIRKTDKFNLILFAGSSQMMASSSVPAVDENINQAIKLIDGQQGGGGTELLPALERALSLPVDDGFSRSVIIITDGYISAEKQAFRLINDNLNKSSFFSFGIGSSVNRYLIEGMAKAGLGEPFVVTKPQEAPATAGRFREYVELPVLTDIKVSYNGFDAYDIEPPNIPTLFAQRPIILFGKWQGEPAGSIQVSGISGSSNYVHDIQVSKAQSNEDNSAIRYLWARERVARLTDYGVSRDNPKAGEEVTSIGLKYSMLTPYTSFIAVIEEIRNTEGQSTDVAQPLPLPMNVSNLAVGGGYSSMSEPGILVLLALILSIVPAIFIYRKKFAHK